MGLFVAGAECSECREANCVVLSAFCVLGMCLPIMVLIMYDCYRCCIVALTYFILFMFPRCGLCHCFLERLNTQSTTEPYNKSNIFILILSASLVRETWVYWALHYQQKYPIVRLTSAGALTTERL